MAELPVPEWTAPASGLFLEKVTYKGDSIEETDHEDLSEMDSDEQEELDEIDEPKHEPIPDHVLKQGKYRAPGAQPEPIGRAFWNSAIHDLRH